MNPVELIAKLKFLYKNFNPAHSIKDDTLYFFIDKKEFETTDYLNFQLTSSQFHYAFISVGFKSKNCLVIKIKKSL